MVMVYYATVSLPWLLTVALCNVFISEVDYRIFMITSQNNL